MPVIIEEPETPVSENETLAAQTAIGMDFPADYRTFLISYNGGRPEPHVFNIQWQPGQPPAEDWRTSGLGWLFSIDSTERSTDLVRMNTVTLRDRIPKGTFAFAHDAGGNQLLLAVEEPFAGKVLFWCKDHEVEEGQTPGYDNVGIVADSFQDFLDNKLY